MTMLTGERLQRWIDELPPTVRAVYDRFPVSQPSGALACYRSTEDPRYHYTIHSYDEGVNKQTGARMPVTVTLIHGSDSTSPGIATFGQDPEQLIVCNCGEWRPPTAAQLEATRRGIERLKRERGVRRH